MTFSEGDKIIRTEPKSAQLGPELGDTVTVRTAVAGWVTLDEYPGLQYLSSRFKLAPPLDLSDIRAEDEVTLTRGSATFSGRVDDLAFEGPVAENRVSLGFYDMPGWFELYGPEAWTVSEYTPAPAPAWDLLTVAEVVNEDGRVAWAVRVGPQSFDGIGGPSEAAWETFPGGVWWEDESVVKVTVLTLRPPVTSVGRQELAAVIEDAIEQHGDGADGMHAAATAAVEFLGLEVLP